MASEEGHRIARVAGSVRAELASVLATTVKDPRARGAVITRVEMPADLRSARVFVRTLGDTNDPAMRRGLLAALRRASGLMRREVGGRLGLRHAPELSFVYDTGVDHLGEVERLLDEIALERKDRERDGG